MIAQTTRTAMLNTLRIGPYDRPYQTNPPVQEWLILSGGGPEGAFLVISDTSVPVTPGAAAAPAGLAEQNSIVAILAEADAQAPQYMMLRHLPDGLDAAPVLPGRFFPADGVVTLSRADDGLRLVAFGRHAHSRGTVGGRSVLHDIPHPAPNADGAINWHFAAEERPWTAATPERTDR